MTGPDDPLSRYQLSPEENARIFREDIAPMLLSGYAPQDNPVVTVLMAQPGAGKSRFAYDIREALDAGGGVVEVDSDLYKPFHPDYAELMATDDQNMAAAIGPDGRAWMAQVQEYVRANRLHAIVHETAQNPDFTLATLQAYRATGFGAVVVALGVHESQSLQGVLHRYQEQAGERGSGRLTVAEKAAVSYRGIPATAQLIDENAAADIVAVYRRDIDDAGPAYVNRLGPGGAWQHPPAFAQAIETERARPLTEREAANFHTVQDELRSNLPAELMARLEHVDALSVEVMPSSQSGRSAHTLTGGDRGVDDAPSLSPGRIAAGTAVAGPAAAVERDDAESASRGAAAQAAETAREATARMRGTADNDRTGRVPQTSAIARAVDDHRARLAFHARSHLDQVGIESARRAPDQRRSTELDSPEQDHGYDPTDY